ncbi:carboxypeptidase-like regulatory domain-containing protein [Flavobacterium sp. F372]|jgi:hypothetical protein|uniref:Carboxypeptidase-like regulatory domain-containing protein n=1 Tax=Flavobacterium bernardetii TaxID=2813823 RepID=A0ABR7J1B5_9FLAO|nr:carboxypeptidase-like regulatory domain-containing protein [Flavobacterium bernardetii]MBC5835855.1 hypothetical protein [Flavobacterium bernardetii]NHF69585.1 carboxypeptidase-like regulatory domain-containing protein [Flavobacterium bernardetii]
MKIKITLFLFCCFQICFSQNIKGNVRATNLPISNVEVINSSKKEVVTTNSEGVFEIKAATGNWLIFYHKNYDVVKIYVDSLFDYSKNLEIKLSEKSTQIEEVIVEKKQPFLKGLKTGMPVIPYNKPSVQFNDGSIPNGMDFIAIGKMIGRLFKNKDKINVKPKEPVQFRTFTAQSYSADFLINSLKLKPEDVEGFLNFCSFDSKSKEAVENSDKLVLLQFLIAKSEEYKKVNQKE